MRKVLSEFERKQVIQKLQEKVEEYREDIKIMSPLKLSAFDLSTALALKHNLAKEKVIEDIIRERLRKDL